MNIKYIPLTEKKILKSLLVLKASVDVIPDLDE